MKIGTWGSPKLVGAKDHPQVCMLSPVPPGSSVFCFTESGLFHWLPAQVALRNGTCCTGPRALSGFRAQLSLVLVTNCSTPSTWFSVGSTIRVSLIRRMTKTPVVTWPGGRPRPAHWWQIARGSRCACGSLLEAYCRSVQVKATWSSSSSCKWSEK